MQREEIEAIVDKVYNLLIPRINQDIHIYTKKYRDRIGKIEQYLGISSSDSFSQSQIGESLINKNVPESQNNVKTVLEQIQEVQAFKQELENSQRLFLQEIKENLVYKSELMKLQSKFDHFESNKKENTQDNQTQQILNQIESQIYYLNEQQKNQEVIINNLKQNQQQVQNFNQNIYRKNSQNQDQHQVKFQTSMINQQFQKFPNNVSQKEQNVLPILKTEQD